MTASTLPDPVIELRPLPWNALYIAIPVSDGSGGLENT